MRIVRDTFGAIASFTVTSAIFGAPMVAILASAVPNYEVADLGPERVVTVSQDWLVELESDEDAVAEVAEVAEVSESVEASEPLIEAVEVPGEAAEAVASRVVEERKVEENAAKVQVPEVAPEPERPSRPRAMPADDVVATTTLVKPAVAPVIRTAQDLRKAATTVAKCGEPHPNIDKVADDRFVIGKDLIDFYTSSMDRFNSLGWSHRHHEDGQKGWYVGGFGCKSVLWKGGLRNRDVVQSVNGRNTNNALQIISLWAFMKKKGDFEVKVLRGGDTVTLHYTVI